LPSNHSRKEEQIPRKGCYSNLSFAWCGSYLYVYKITALGNRKIKERRKKETNVHMLRRNTVPLFDRLSITPSCYTRMAGL